jgi:hypothetical protein
MQGRWPIATMISWRNVHTGPGIIEFHPRIREKYYSGNV